MVSKINKFVVGVLAFAWMVISVTGCQYGGTSYQGKNVDDENRIDLTGDSPRSGTWITRDISVSYEIDSYETGHQTGQLAISGDVAFANHLINGYVDIMLTMRINFYDADGKVIAGNPVNLPRYSQYRPVLPFQERIALPPAVQGFAFSYNGQARDGSDVKGLEKERGGSFVWNFWKAP